MQTQLNIINFGILKVYSLMIKNNRKSLEKVGTCGPITLLSALIVRHTVSGSRRVVPTAPWHSGDPLPTKTRVQVAILTKKQVGK